MFLLINPYICDFSAYDMWMMPLGLLHLGSFLKNQGYDVQLIDLLSVDYDSKYFGVKRKATGDGKLPFKAIEKPEALRDIPKNYKMYGIPEELFIKEIQKLPDRPEAIFITSKMTYWYPGIIKTISILREFFKDTKIILGGTYAKLLPEHAKKFTGADPDFFCSSTGVRVSDGLDKFDLDYYQMDLSLLPGIRFLPLLSTLGCPFNCTYCASKKLFASYRIFNPEKVLEQLLIWHEKYSVKDITIFDDAFLDSRGHAKNLLKLLIDSKIRFRVHAPNALHARFIDAEMAELMRTAGFYTIRIGLESINKDFQKRAGAKVFNNEFLSAVKNLHMAGYKPEEIGVYVMCGLPFQKREEVLSTIKFVIESGAKPKLVEYSPVPGTPLFEKAKMCSPFNLDEPLFHNNSLLPCQWTGFTYNDYIEIKNSLQKKQPA